jgi:hypothetical protein
MGLKNCPFCGSSAEVFSSAIIDGRACRCSNKRCYLSASILTFAEWNRRSPAEQKWISVKERLPDIIDDYMGCSEPVLCAVFEGDTWHNEVGRRFKKYWGTSHIVPTHWQPLPTPPRKDEKL